VLSSYVANANTGAITFPTAEKFFADFRLRVGRGMEEAIKTHKLDALLFPGASGAAIAAKPGGPTVIVPFGMVPNAPTPPCPSGLNAKPAPFGVSLTGLACSEPRLIELAYAFEQAAKRRVPPAFSPGTEEDAKASLVGKK
jgi:amidase